MWEWDFDIPLIKGNLHAAIKLTANIPLLNRLGLNPCLNHHRAVGKLINTQYLQGLQNPILEVFVCAQVFIHLAHDCHHFVRVLTVCHTHIHQVITEVFGQVGDDRYFTERNRMDSTIEVTHLNLPQRNLLNQPKMIINLDDVTNLQQILEDDGQPGQKILHQGLRTKTDSNTQDTCTGQ